MNALLPSIIKSGSEKYPSAREMSIHQDDLYGVSIGADSSKRGESQVITFKITSFFIASFFFKIKYSTFVSLLIFKV